jgi:hypothetical protein
MTRRPGLLPAHHWLATDRCAAEARKTKVAGWGALNGLPNCLDPAYLQKRLSVSPRGDPWGVLIDEPWMPGGFFGRVSKLSRSLHPHAPAPCSIYWERHCEVCGDRTGHFSGSGGGAVNGSAVLSSPVTSPTRTELLTRSRCRIVVTFSATALA